ncbi:MAG: hypothetical protein ACFFCG_04535 [Promethearchaeota archaeon]
MTNTNILNNLISNDFDPEVQFIFDKLFSDIPPTNWKKWLEISSKEEYLSCVLKNSGLSTIPDIFERIIKEKTNSTKLSIDIQEYLSEFHSSEPLIVCHSSGTTNNDLNSLKWLHMSKKIAKLYWAPGMQAIFESSGLNSDSSVVIFVPSRLNIDGLNTFENKKYISLYSSEFSQRLMLSILKPSNFTFFEYKFSKNINIVAKILSLNNVSVISAPAITILGWADIEKFQIGLQKSIKDINLESCSDPLLENLLLKIKKKGIETAAKEIQKMLSNKLSHSVIVFSISSLSLRDWDLIRRFMKWEKGNEKFTNLYVASEAGPFAASIDKDSKNRSHSDDLIIFPLTLPVLEYEGEKKFISESKNKIGKLLISRINNNNAFINLDIGDIIQLTNQQALPQINGKILRSEFQLKYPIKMNENLTLKGNYTVYAGDYFNFDTFEIYDPRTLINCLKIGCKSDYDSLLLIESEEDINKTWKLVLNSDSTGDCSNLEICKQTLLNCIKDKDFRDILTNGEMEIQLIEENPVDFLKTRPEVLDKVRSGKNPKGILKKWPLYVIKWS